MDQQQFEQLAVQGYNRIPLHREILADLDTPLSVYLKFAHAPYSYLFESVQGGEKWGRYSIIGLPCKDQYEVYGHRINHIRQGHLVSSDEYEDPLEFIDQLQARFKVPKLEHLPLFTGGLVGYFAYDTVRYIEPRLGDCPNPDEINTPDILLMLSEEVVVFDNLSGTLHIVVHVDPSQADALELGMQRLDHLEQKLARTIPEYLKNADSNQALLEDDFISGFTEDGFKQAVEKARKYIIEGDIMQVVLSQRLTVDYHGEALDLYRALRRLNPSPYMFFLNLGGFHVVGSSPEILVRMEDHKVTVRPIAGTRPRGKTVDEDLALEADLLADPKELAEHLMLIDLGRNDVGRVAHVGSVKLTDKMIIERYSHVMHIVSNVIGQVDEGTSPMDILRATFPAGTVSGAAKVRAMEIIDELEPVKRGIYAGAVGYIGWHGNIDTAIAIRTAVIKDQKLYLQAGAGVVYDSIPENEWLETMNKGRAVMKAAVMASKSDSDKVHR